MGSDLQFSVSPRDVEKLKTEDLTPRRNDGNDRNQVAPGERLLAARGRADLRADGARIRESAGSNVAGDSLGFVLLHHLHRRLGVFGTESRTGDGGGDSDRDSGDRPGARLQAPLD